MRGVAILCALLLTGCDGINSAFDSNNEQPQPVPIEKPGKCLVNFANTCWSATVQKITDCLKAAKGKDTFSASQEFCSNSSGKLIAFKSPVDIFTKPFDALHTQIEFKVLPDMVQECFSVSGVANQFDVTLHSGEVVSFYQDADKVNFSCLDGQQVSVAVDNYKGCEKSQGNEFLKSVPGMEFGPFEENGVERGWSFKFRGAPSSPEVFRCYYP